VWLPPLMAFLQPLFDIRAAPQSRYSLARHFPILERLETQLAL
jgi:hypothetical protein